VERRYVLQVMAVERVRRKRRRGVWLLVAVLSLLAHGLGFGMLLLLGALAPPHPPEVRPQEVTLRPLDAREWDRRRGRRAEPPGQVVDVAPGNRESSPSARFLAASNNRVQRETRARVQTPRPSPAPAPPSPVEPPPAAAPEHRVPNLIPDFRPLDPGPSPTESQPASAAPGEAGAFNDDLQDVAEGDGTFLNTREWRFASFFNRLKASVSEHWHPRQVLLSTRHVNDPVTRITVVRVTMSTSGAVTHVEVVHPCGFQPLDEEAVRAFRSASPFLNPPEALFGGGDAFSFNFSFHVDTLWPSSAQLPRLRP